jgi:hypothetical protein
MLVMVDRVTGGGRAVQPPSPGLADFTIMKEYTQKNGLCHFVCTLWCGEGSILIVQMIFTCLRGMGGEWVSTLCLKTCWRNVAGEIMKIIMYNCAGYQDSYTSLQRKPHCSSVQCWLPSSQKGLEKAQQDKPKIICKKTTSWGQFHALHSILLEGKTINSASQTGNCLWR